MSVSYTLWNATKRERISFMHINASTAREIAGQPAAAAIVAWYLIQNPGDEISILPEGTLPPSLARHGVDPYSLPDCTSHYVEQLIAEGILKDNGLLYCDEDEPASVYIRDLQNRWVESDT
ncbi:hypothetical protein [Pseudomonas solani]|uniref:hypothetical protein n=1 Tax=Pseudomonas solani TaxID=2731552 RepID=UPI003D6AD80F